MYGIYVESTQAIDYARAIVEGRKMIETRTRNTLKALAGERVAIIRTMAGRNPAVVGYATMGNGIKVDGETFETLRPLHLIPPGSKFDHTGNGKWCYPIISHYECIAYPLPEHKNHGRSYCEFTPRTAEGFADFIKGVL